MNVYYMGSIADLPKEYKAVVDEFICLGVPTGAECCSGAVTLGTVQDGVVRLTVIGLLKGSNTNQIFMQCDRQSQKAKNLSENGKAEVSIANGRGYVISTCTGEILDDPQIREEKWDDWMYQYHKDGFESENYVVLRLVPQQIRAMF